MAFPSTPGIAVIRETQTDDASTEWGPGFWALSPNYSLEQKLTRWALWTMMKQREISWEEIREELGGISNARLGQLLKQTDRDAILFRLEDAIEAITKRKHAKLCDCDDYAGCAVFTAVHPTDESMRDAKKGALNQWRERTHQTGQLPSSDTGTATSVPPDGESTPTASRVA